MLDIDSARSQVEHRMQQFRVHYPMGGIVTNVAAIRGENYVVQAVLSVGGIALTSGLAEASTLEGAEAIAQLIALDRFNPAPGVSSVPGVASGPTAFPASPSSFVTPPQEATPEASVEDQAGGDQAGGDQAMKGQTAEDRPKDLETNLPKANLSETNLSEANLPEANLPEAKLNGKNGKAKPKSKPSKPKRSKSKAEKPVKSPVSESPVSEPSFSETPIPETSAPPEDLSSSDAPGSQDSAPQFVADWSDDLAQIEVEIKRLGWDAKQEAEYLQRTYGKPSRDYITDYGELTDFLGYLRSLPSHFVPESYSEPEAEIHIPADYDDGPATASTPQSAPESIEELPASEPPASEPPAEEPPAQNDFGGLSRDDMMQQSAAECKRLKWTNRQGSNFLKSRYNKPTRKDLNDSELWDFLQYLSSIAPVETSVTEQLPF